MEHKKSAYIVTNRHRVSRKKKLKKLREKVQSGRYYISTEALALSLFMAR